MRQLLFEVKFLANGTGGSGSSTFGRYARDVSMKYYHVYHI